MQDIKFEEIVCRHQERYPQMEVQDFIKLTFQSVFGGGHLVTDGAASLARLEAELQEVKARTAGDAERASVGAEEETVFARPEAEDETEQDRTMQSEQDPFEDVGGNHSRLYLDRLQGRLSLETVNRIFLASAREAGAPGRTETAAPGGAEVPTPEAQEAEFRQKMELIRRLCEEGRFSFGIDAFDQDYRAYLQQGIRPIHHSRRYNACYHPAYRIVKRCYHRYLKAFEAVEALLQEPKVIKIAIDGRSASGKSTLGLLLQEIYGGNLFHMDDFFLQNDQRTEARLAEPGGNVDYERFKAEVLDQLASQSLADIRPFSYQLFSCAKRQLTDVITVTPSRLNIIEGSYSQQPYFGDAYDLRFFLDIGQKEQLERIEKRNGPVMLEKFRDIWIPMEEKYFDAFAIRKKSILIE